jgi:hypothetical protein
MSVPAERPLGTISPMAKLPMRVIPEPSGGSRSLVTAERHAGSMAIKGSDGASTFLCGRCRDILAKSVGPDYEFVHEYDEDTDEFRPLYRVRDVVFRCKGCGAFNEVAEPS